MRRFEILFRADGDMSNYSERCHIENDVWKFQFDGNKRSTEKSIINQCKHTLGFTGNKLVEVISVNEVEQ